MNAAEFHDFILEGVNKDEPIVVTKHADLERINDSTQFKSHCPKCTSGTLLVHRHPVSMKLQAHDCCILCAQKFIYEDINDLCEKTGEAGPHVDIENPLPHKSSVKNKNPTRFSNLTIPED